MPILQQLPYCPEECADADKVEILWEPALSVSRKRRSSEEELKRANAEQWQKARADTADQQLWTDGGVKHLPGGFHYSGAAAVLYMRPHDPQAQPVVLQKAGGPEACSFTVEDSALFMGLSELESIHPDQRKGRCLVGTDCQSDLRVLAKGPLSQTTTQGARLWHLILKLISTGTMLTFAFFFSHLGIPGNEAADRAATEAATRGRRGGRVGGKCSGRHEVEMEISQG